MKGYNKLVKPARSSSGFTIVELLIVIVIIGILAALVIVAYTGIQNRANDTAVQTDLRNIGQKFELYNGEFGVYPPYAMLANGSLNIKATKSAYYTVGAAANLALCGSNQHYAVIAMSKSGNKFSFSSINGLKPFTAAMTGIVASCDSAGIYSTEPGYWRDWGYNSGASGVWYSWIGG